MQSPVRVGGESSDASSLGYKPTTALTIFHVPSPLLRLLNKVPTGSVQYGFGTQLFFPSECLSGTLWDINRVGCGIGEALSY